MSLARLAEKYLLPPDKQSDRRSRLFVNLCLAATLTALIAATLTLVYGYEQLAVGIYFGALTLPLGFVFLRFGMSALPAGHYLTANIMLQTLFFAAMPAVATVAMVALAGAVALLGKNGGRFWLAVIVAYCVYIALSASTELESALGTVAALMSAVVFTIVNATERSRALASLRARTSTRQSTEQISMLQRLISRHFDGIMQVNDGQPVFVSDGVSALLGYSIDEIVNRPLGFFLHPDEKSLPQLLDVGDSVQREELRLRHAEGHWIWVEAYIAPDMQGHRTQWRSIILRNYDAQKKAAEQLVQAQRLESMGTMAAAVAHDFNNMLTVIMGFADELPEGEARSEIIRVASSAAHLTNQLLTFGHGQRSGNEILDLSHLLREQSALLRHSLDSRYVLIESYQEDPVLVRIAPSHFDQVFINLLNNAREAMPDGGHVEISLYSVELPGTEVRDAGQFGVLEIRDSGIGMDEATQAKAFDPFFSTKPDKSAGGLGLSSCYGIVSQYGGFMEIDSTPGQGTATRVYLPISETQAHEPVLELIDNDATIVVVDDDPGVLAVVHNALRRAGYRTRTFTEPSQAVEFFDRANVCLLITDVVMQTMDGSQLAAKLRAVEPDLPVLFISGFAREYLDEWELNDTTRFLAKPFRGDEIVARSETLLRVTH